MKGAGRREAIITATAVDDLEDIETIEDRSGDHP
jgi:hypothetical protein